jgi:Ser/Thr protein kinase RdoA (MazF antagonist)
MKPYEELTRRGRLLRMRGLAHEALKEFGAKESHFSLLRQAGNTLFRVHTSSLPTRETAGGLFEEEGYLLRVHQPSYQQIEALELELAWLADMRREADLPVPEPVPAPDGRLLLPVSVPGVPGTRHCSLLRWVKGNLLEHSFRPHHLQAQGRLMAKLHNFAVRWRPPEGLSKRRFDWNGLFMDDVGSDMPNSEAWALLTPENKDAFSFVAEWVREVMEDWGQGPEVYGLIHGDLAVDANLLFWHGEPRAIDFDDSGFGYWVYDLAVALDAPRDDPAYPRYREALLNGYVEFRSLPEKQAEQLELFLAAQQVYWNLWATGGTHLYPHLHSEFDERIANTADFVMRYVRQRGG